MKVEGRDRGEDKWDWMISEELPALKLLGYFHIKQILFSRIYKFAILHLCAGRDLSNDFVQMN